MISASLAVFTPRISDRTPPGCTGPAGSRRRRGPEALEDRELLVRQGGLAAAPVGLRQAEVALRLLGLEGDGGLQEGHGVRPALLFGEQDAELQPRLRVLR